MLGYTLWSWIGISKLLVVIRKCFKDTLIHTDSVCVSYLHRAVFRDLFQSGAFGLQVTIFFQEAFRSSDLPQRPVNNWTRAVYADTHRHTRTHKQLQKPTINQQVQRFSPSCLLFVYTTNLQVLFKLLYSFLQWCRLHTHTRLLETQCRRSRILHATRLATKHQHAHTCIHTSSSCVAWCSRPPFPTTPPPLRPPGAACQSVSQSV